MRKIIITTLILSFLFSFLTASQKEFYKKIYTLYGQENYTEALKMIEKGVKNYGASQNLLKLKYNILMILKKYDEALALIDKEIVKSGETQELISAKYKVLFRQGKLHQALNVAMKKYKIAKIKSPWDCMAIMHVHLRMGNKQDALDWLQEAVSRGFISYRILAGKRYASLQNEKRLYEIIETIKVAIGLGKSARDFSVKLLTGKDFTLSRQRGKVVLLYFWATWCDSCMEEIPKLNEFYKEFKPKGFEIIGINLDSREEKLREYIEKINLEWNFIFSGKVWKDETAKLYGVNSLPSHWLIDKKGILRSFGLKGEELRKAIAFLLAEK